MADPVEEHRHVSPIGTVIHEPTFPGIRSDSPKSSKHTKLEPNYPDGSEPTKMTSEEGATQAQLSRSQTQPETSSSIRPLQKSATERPRSTPKHSLLERMQSGPHKKQATHLDNMATLTFDPYSSESDSNSDSDSDSSDEERFPKHSLSHDDGLTTQGTNKQRSPSRHFSSLKIANEHFKTRGKISKADGRLKLSILEKDLHSGYIAKALGAVLKKHPKDDDENVQNYDTRELKATKIAPEDDEMEHNPSRRVKLNIAIIIIGSRGDIQPFIRIAKILKDDYGHRVRLATHPAFKDFVEKDSGLEFFSVGGNPAELMAFMVKNPGLIPNIETIKDGEIGRRRAQMYEMFQGMWRACINATDDEPDDANAKMMADKQPFIADAIIANPPSFAAPHIAEKLGIPLHMMFTFPYTPTVHFPHPLANVKASNIEATYSNFMSYPLVEMMMWQGLGDLINRFRSQILYLEEVSTLWAPGQLYRLKVPYTYMWSPALIPKPKDWGPEIDISGFVFLDLASSFTPPADLTKFLDAGDPPVYIGFGSIVVDDPDEFTKLIFEAVKIAGCRALVSKGWGGFGSNADCPDNIFMIDNTPHDWLFPRCSAVVHHGGAGTTAIGLKCAKPTMIVPFFGDQPFWGAMVSKAKAGAHDCIPYKKLDAERLATGIKQCLTEEARTNVQKIADSIEMEGDGALNSVRSFHRSLPLRGDDSMRCDFLEDRAAVWKIKKTNIKLSALAAEILIQSRMLKWSELRLVRHYEWNDFGGPGEPVTGLWGSLMSTVTDAATGVGGVPLEMGKSIKKRERIMIKKHKMKKRNEHKIATLAEANSAFQDDKARTNKHPVESRPKATREESTLSKISEPDEDLAQELGHEAAFGFKKTGAAIARFPMNVTLALAQGFHNAPRLYGDETVRRPPRVTGFHSGLRAGRDEFIYGVRDGVTGIVTQPWHGAKNGGLLGAVRGFGLGVGGVVLKDIAAFLGPAAYIMKGLDAEYMKRYQPTAYLRRARMTQGVIELRDLVATTEDRQYYGAGGDTAHNVATRAQIEESVGVKWQALRQTITDEKKKNKTGVFASLTGRSEKKDGQRMPRKSMEDAKKETKRSQSKARTATVAQDDKARESEERKSADGPTLNGLTRSRTAPAKSSNKRETSSLSDSGAPMDASKLEGKGSEASKDLLLNNNSSIDLASGNNSQALLYGPQHLEVTKPYDLPHRLSADASSDRTRVGSDTTEWLPQTQKTDNLGEHRVAPAVQT